MRNLNECQAEVFRRSEKRIKERKQRRNHILMACIPLVLGISLFSASVFAGHSAKAENGNESLTCSIAKIEVSGPGISLSYTEPSDVVLISDQLNSYSAVEPESDGSVKEEAKGENVKENADGSDIYGSLVGSSNAEYTIILVAREGGNTEYYLTGNTLANRTTNQTYTLSQTQINELKDLLGIPHQ